MYSDPFHKNSHPFYCRLCCIIRNSSNTHPLNREKTSGYKHKSLMCIWKRAFIYCYKELNASSTRAFSKRVSNIILASSYKSTVSSKRIVTLGACLVPVA